MSDPLLPQIPVFAQTLFCTISAYFRYKKGSPTEVTVFRFPSNNIFGCFFIFDILKLSHLFDLFHGIGNLTKSHPIFKHFLLPVQ